MKYLSLLFLLTLPLLTSAQTDSTTTAPRKNALQEVAISGSRTRLRQHVESTQMGKVDLPVSLLLKAPAIGGEPDIVKAMQLTPGVKRGTEGGIGMYVRGGGNDENLILLDGAPVYNAGHLLGFFSIFNAGTVRDAQLYKSSFPAQYGGRLSSVLDVRTKDGSLTDYKASASIGLIASSATIQGPILKNRLSFMVSGRRTYIDQVFRYIPYHFYDVNAKLTYVEDPQNRIYLSAYKGDDVLRMAGGKDIDGDALAIRSGMKLGNQTLTARWNHAPASGAYTTDLGLVYTGFRYAIDGSLGGNMLSVRSAIRDLGVKGDIRRVTADKRHHLSGGFSLTNHYFNPNIVQSDGPELDDFSSRDGRHIYTNELALYANDDFRLTERWQLAGGLRLSAALASGITYVNPEPRLAVRYLIDGQRSIKASYARMSQYMHLVSSSSLVLPTDLWYPVTAQVKPGVSDQVSAGYYHSIPALNVTLSAEGYYKWMQHLVEYREGALLVLNDNYEQELLHGKGRSYGLELFASRTSGKLTGWIGYSLSWSHRTFDSLNKGREYYARYDRRHDLSLVAAYEINKRWSASTNVIYATGSPFTGQVGQYAVPSPGFDKIDVLPVYTSRNELRLSSSFRIDLDLGYKFRLGNRLKGDAHLSVYNLLNRTQPGRVERVWNEEKGTFTYQQKGLFGTITTAAINFNL